MKEQRITQPDPVDWEEKERRLAEEADRWIDDVLERHMDVQDWLMEVDKTKNNKVIHD